MSMWRENTGISRSTMNIDVPAERADRSQRDNVAGVEKWEM